MPTNSATLEVMDMPTWKHNVLRAVAWLLGYRGQYVYCVTTTYNLEDLTNDQT